MTNTYLRPTPDNHTSDEMSDASTRAHKTSPKSSSSQATQSPSGQKSGDQKTTTGSPSHPKRWIPVTASYPRTSGAGTGAGIIGGWFIQPLDYPNSYNNPSPLGGNAGSTASSSAGGGSPSGRGGGTSHGGRVSSDAGGSRGNTSGH